MSGFNYNRTMIRTISAPNYRCSWKGTSRQVEAMVLNELSVTS